MARGGRPAGRELARQLRASVVEDEALRMAADGFSVREVAEAQGCSVATAHGRLQRGLERLPRGNAVLWRDLVDREIAEVKAEAWRLVRSRPRVVSAGRVVDVEDVVAVNGALNTVLKALERQSRLRGLDAPVRQSVTVVDNRVVEEAIAELESRLSSGGGDVVDVEVVEPPVLTGSPEFDDGDVGAVGEPAEPAEGPAGAVAEGPVSVDGGVAEGAGDGGPGAAGEVREVAAGFSWGEGAGAVPLVL